MSQTSIYGRLKARWKILAHHRISPHYNLLHRVVCRSGVHRQVFYRQMHYCRMVRREDVNQSMIHRQTLRQGKVYQFHQASVP